MSFQDDMRTAAMQRPPCAECNHWHSGFCPVPGPKAKNAGPSAEVLALLGLFAEAIEPTGDVWYACRLRCGDTIAFCRAIPTNGLWVELLGVHLVNDRGDEPWVCLRAPLKGKLDEPPTLMTKCERMRSLGFRTSYHIRLDEVQWVTKQGEDVMA